MQKKWDLIHFENVSGGFVRSILLLLFLSVMFPQLGESSEVPRRMVFSGYLTDPGGFPINGTFDARFSIIVDGTKTWCAQYPTAITDGSFFVVLGSSGVPLKPPDDALDSCGRYGSGETPTTTTDLTPDALTTSNATSNVKLVVSFLNGDNWEDLLPGFELSTSLYAIKAETLAGIPVEGFIRAPGSVAGQQNVSLATLIQLTGTQDASSLHHHDSLYSKSGEAANYSSVAIGAGGSGSVAIGSTGVTITGQGDITLARAPSLDMQATTKKYVDDLVNPISALTLGSGLGGAGALLSSTGTTTEWVNSSSTGTTANTIVKRGISGAIEAGPITASALTSSGTITAGALTSSGQITATGGITTPGTITLTGTTSRLSLPSGTGSSGQVLTSKGSGASPVWETPSSISSGGTGQTTLGTAGSVLATNPAGTATEWVSSSSTGTTANTIVKRGTSGAIEAGPITASALTSSGQITATGGITTPSTIALTGTATLSTGGSTGTTGQVLKSGGTGPPTWSDLTVTTTVPMSLGGTGQAANGTSGQVLSSQGNGSSTWITPTTANTASALVKRDGSGGFAAGAISATALSASGQITATGGITTPSTIALTGTATLSTGGSTGTTGQVLKSGGAGAPTWEDLTVTTTVPMSLGGTGQAANGTSGQVLSSQGNGSSTWITPTNTSTANTLVKRDGSGGFAAGAISATALSTSGDITLTGTASLAVSGTVGTAGQVLVSTGSGAPQWSNSGVPVGSIMAFAGTSVPTGWKLCDGASYSTSTYNSLFSVISYSHGGSGSSFNVPDYRGRFLRMVDGGILRDPDRTSRTAMATGGNTGDLVGSVQSDSYQTHSHSMSARTESRNFVSGQDSAYDEFSTLTDEELNITSFNQVLGTKNDIPSSKYGTYSGSCPAGYDDAGSAATTATRCVRMAGTLNTDTSGGSTETRPENAYVNYIIKY